VELAKAEGVVEKPAGEMTSAEQWAVYFRYLTDRTKRTKINEVIAEEEGIAMASEVLITISKDEIERARLMSEWKYEVDTQSKLVEAKRAGIKEVARNFKKLGIPIEQIAQGTGLTEQQITDL
jgi:predicted transposase/invertase (TIGR01784 family)